MRILLTLLFVIFYIANNAQSEELKLVYQRSTEEANKRSDTCCQHIHTWGGIQTNKLKRFYFSYR